MSPRSAKQLDDIRKQKKKLILETALELFAESGFHSTSISQIAKKAGISKGLIYNYFESKKEVLDEIIREGTNSVYEGFDLNRDGVLTTDEFIYFIRRTFRVISENPRYWKLFYSLILQPTVTESYKNDYADYSTQLYSILYQFVVTSGNKNPEGTLIAISTLLKGTSLILVTAADLFPTKTFEDQIIEACFKLINN